MFLDLGRQQQFAVNKINDIFLLSWSACLLVWLRVQDCIFDTNGSNLDNVHLID